MATHRYQKHLKDTYQKRRLSIINLYALKQNPKIGVCGKHQRI